MVTFIPNIFLAFATSAILQPDGKIVVAGDARQEVSPFLLAFTLIRYNPDGTLDTSFDGDGIIVSRISGANCEARALAIQTDGKIVAAGWVFNSVSGFADVGLARYHPNGALDTSFGSAGVVKIAVSFSSDYVNALAVQPDGKIVAAGSGWFPATLSESFALARLNPNGSLDATFGSGGVVVTDISNQYESARAVAVQPDGKIVAAGYTGNLSISNNFIVVRYLGDAVSRRSQFDFDGDGRADDAVFRPSNGVWYQQLSQAGFGFTRFGLPTDVITPADYDGDGKTDVAVFRNGTWYLNRSQTGFTGVAFGAAGDRPIPSAFAP